MICYNSFFDQLSDLAMVASLRCLSFTDLVFFRPIRVVNIYMRVGCHISDSDFDVELPNYLVLNRVSLFRRGGYLCLSCNSLVSPKVRRWDRHGCRYFQRTLDTFDESAFLGNIPGLEGLALRSILEFYSENNLALKVTRVYLMKGIDFLFSRFDVKLPDNRVFRNVLLFSPYARFCRSCFCLYEWLKFCPDHVCQESYRDYDSDECVIYEEGCLTCMSTKKLDCHCNYYEL